MGTGQRNLYVFSLREQQQWGTSKQQQQNEEREWEAGLTYFVHDQQKIKEDNVRGAVKDPSNSSLT